MTRQRKRLETEKNQRSYKTNMPPEGNVHKECEHGLQKNTQNQRMPKAAFSQPCMCMKKSRTINLSNTQCRYQLVFFIHKCGWLKVAFGICCLGKTCRRHLLPGGMYDFYNVKVNTASVYYKQQ